MGAGDSETNSVVNFAYGSNMLLARIRERAPSATPLGVAELPGHQLRWHKVGRDGSGKCDVVPCVDAETAVFGVLYRIPASERPALDRAEGLGSGYAEKRVLVLVNGAPIEAFVYYATDVQPALQPYSWYKAIVVAGAKQHGLPPQYIALLEAVAATTDPDRLRHSKHMALADAG